MNTRWLAVLVVALSLVPRTSSVRADFYVATNGNNDNPGTRERPFSTLARARDAVRQLQTAEPRKKGATVLVRGGTYVLKETLLLGPKDSGTPEHPIVYAAYPGEEPILSGGRAIPGWKRAQGKRWQARVPPEMGRTWRFTQLFVNGKRQTRGRMPDSDDWRRWWQVAAGPPHATVFHFPDNTLADWPNLSDVEINLIPQYYWQNQIIPLGKLDMKSHSATLATPPPAYAIYPGNPFRAENVLSAVTRPGTWSLDTHAGVVTLWPEDGVDLTRSVVTAPVLPLLIRCEGADAPNSRARGLVFRGLTFTQTAQVPMAQRDPQDTGTLDTNDCALLFQGATDCTVERCRFVQTGGYGVRLKHAATGIRILENDFAECGGGGVLLTGYGPGTRDVNRGNIIAGNHIHHCGVFFWHCPGISLTQSGENIIAFNHLHDLPYGGVLVADCSVDYFREFRGKQGRGFQFRWDEIGNDPLTFDSVKRFTHSRRNQIVYNTIHDVVQRLEDSGAIHIGFVGGHNVVRGNLIHDVRAAAKCWGLYTDAETNRERIEGNVVWSCPAPHIDYEQGGPNNNQWSNNVLSTQTQEPPEAKTLRGKIAARRKKGLSAPDVRPEATR
jgi:hypothetical protein